MGRRIYDAIFTQERQALGKPTGVFFRRIGANRIEWGTVSQVSGFDKPPFSQANVDEEATWDYVYSQAATPIPGFDPFPTYTAGRSVAGVDAQIDSIVADTLTIGNAITDNNVRLGYTGCIPPEYQHTVAGYDSAYVAQVRSLVYRTMDRYISAGLTKVVRDYCVLGYPTVIYSQRGETESVWFESWQRIIRTYVGYAKYMARQSRDGRVCVWWAFIHDTSSGFPRSYMGNEIGLQWHRKILELSVELDFDIIVFSNNTNELAYYDWIQSGSVPPAPATILASDAEVQSYKGFEILRKWQEKAEWIR